MKRKTLMQKLSDKGVHVVGTTEEFNGYKGGIWVAADSTPQLFNPYGGPYKAWPEINHGLQKFVEKNGWYFDWYDNGTIMVWKN